MAKRARRRVNSGAERYQRTTYEEGSAVRKLSDLPEEEERQELPQRRVSRQTSRNRRRALQMGKGYVLFLAVICAASVLMCVNYLQKKAQVTTQSEEIAAMESTLSKLKADNDAYYNTVIASVSLETIKDAALNRLGLKYPDQSQVQYYTTEGNSYVRQYTAVPEAK